jgi:HAMP domain-containing protein
MSFTEMMESGRGPGVIGMLLALVVIAGFGVLFMFAFDEGLQGADYTIEALITKQTQEIADLERAISNGNQKLDMAPALKADAGQLNDIRSSKRSGTRRIATLKYEITSADKSLAEMTEDFESYKDDYRALVRGRARDEQMDTLGTRKGMVYQNVTIKSVTPVGIQIMHDGGFKRIPYEELPPAMQDRFQFDPKQKQAALAMEDSQRKEHEAAVSIVKESEARDLNEQKNKREEARRQEMIRSIAFKESRIDSLRDEIESLNDALAKEHLKRISRAPIMRSQLAQKQNEINQLQQDIIGMRAAISR